METAAPFVWGSGGARMTPEQIESQKKIARALMEKGMDYSPIQSPWQGAARVAQALMGGLEDAEATAASRRNAEADREMLASIIGGAPTATGAVPNAGVSPMGKLPSLPDRIYSENEFNPIDAQAATPEELAAGVPAPKKYASLIGKAAVDNDLPPALLAAQIKQESGFNPNAVSPAGATGISQFMPGTAREMGVNPLDPASAIPGGARYLRQNIDKFGGSIPLGLAAYNAGPGRVEQSGGDISRLPAETQGYVRNITGAAPVQVAQSAPAVNPRVLEAATSPYSSPQTKAIANIILQQQMKQDGATDEIKEYNLYSRQEQAAGRAPKTFFDFKADLKKAGAQNISIDQRGEAAFDTAAGKHQAERFDKLVSGGMDAKAMRADLEALKDIGSRITTGKTAELTAALGPYAEAAGIKIDGLDDLQAYKSIVAKLAPRMRVVGSGATSDYEMRQFLEALPGLGKTPGGNEMISATLQALQDHKEQAAEIASRAMNKEITPREADKMLRALPDPLTAWKAANKKGTLSATPSQPSVDDLVKKYTK